jgi:2-(1,2-epoxy-1,2-dihydrophenyl)acetyl-CoA isomerase
MTFEAGRVCHDGRVLRIRIVRGLHGTLDGSALPVVTAALTALDPTATGAVLIHSDGPSFCTGGDVQSFVAAGDRSGFVGGLAASLHRFVAALADCPVPVVAGVQGWAAGAGMSVVCAVDIAVAGRSTRFRPGYPGIGFSPDGGLTWTLPKIIGAARARRILLTDEVLDAETACAIGIVGGVVEDAKVLVEAERIAHRVANGPTAALGRIKRLLAVSPDMTLTHQLELEASAIAASAAGPEGMEGLAAFVAKRAPEFRGLPAETMDAPADVVDNPPGSSR